MAKIKTTTRRIEDLKVYENNPRRNDKAIGAVRESIKKFGFLNPVLINGDNVIIAGHTRVAALKESGVDSVMCIELTHLSPDEEKAFRMADNRVAEFSIWDQDLLQDEIREIGADDWEQFGFKQKDLGFLAPPENCTCPKCGKTFVKVK